MIENVVQLQSTVNTEVVEFENTENQTEVNNENHVLDVPLQTLIRENSWFYCEHCDYKTKRKNGLKIHIGKMHEIPKT